MFQNQPKGLYALWLLQTQENVSGITLMLAIFTLFPASKLWLQFSSYIKHLLRVS